MIYARLAPWEEEFSPTVDDGRSRIAARPPPKPTSILCDGTDMRAVSAYLRLEEEVVLDGHIIRWEDALGVNDVRVYTTVGRLPDICGRAELFCVAMRLVRWILANTRPRFLVRVWCRCCVDDPDGCFSNDEIWGKTGSIFASEEWTEAFLTEAEARAYACEHIGGAPWDYAIVEVRPR